MSTVDWVFRGIGIAMIMVAFYIILSLFLPLWRPPIRDEQAIRERREKAERQIVARRKAREHDEDSA